MTALYMDGFDHYGANSVSATNMLDGSWAFVDHVTCATPVWGAARTGTYCLRGDGFSGGIRYAVPTPGTTFFISFGFAVDSLQAGVPWPIDVRDSSGNVLVYLTVNASGQIAVVNSANTVLAITNGPVIKTQNWHFIEVEFNTSSHNVVLRVDDAAGSGTPLINVTDSTITGTIGLISFLENAGGVIGNVDDVFIRDSNGSVNNAFLGDRRVATLLADASTTTNAWTPNYYQVVGSAGILQNTEISPVSGLFLNSSTSFDVGSGDYTLETFVRFQALPSGSNKAVIFSRWDSTPNQRSYEFYLGSVGLNSGCLELQTSTDGTTATLASPIIYPWTPNLNTWYHIALVRASGEDLLFVNGQQLGLPIADSRTYFTGISPLGIGGEATTSSNPIGTGTQLEGWFNQARMTVGYARYTANFTPTTVEWPTGSADPHWADVSLLVNTDTLNLVQDTSSFAHPCLPQNGCVQQAVNDGPSVGSWSTVGKSVPDDNTFISAPFVSASSILTLSAQPAVSDTVTVGTKNGSTAAVYTFKTTITTAFDVLIDTSLQQTLANLYNAINAGPGSGTKYGTGTTSNFDVNAVQLPAGQMQVYANTAGTAGNSITTSVSLTHGGSWTGSTLSGGLSIPGPTNFSTQRLPPTTTLISAVQISVRSFKSDAGLGSINSALIGPLGGVSTGPTHSLTVSPNYYNDIYQTDPDTSGPISPTTVTNGKIQINRDT